MRFRPPRLEIITLHRVLEDGHGYFIPPMALEASTFEKLITSSARDFRITDLSEAASDLKDMNPRHNHLAVTFDDGYIDNYQLARDLLLPKGIPATFFVPILQIDAGKPYWWDYIYSIASGDTKAFRKWFPSALASAIPSLKAQATPSFPSALPRWIRELVRQLNGASRAERNRFLLSVEKEFGPYRGPRLLMNWEEIRELRASGFSIGSHSISHEPLTDLGREEAIPEIVNSRTELAARLGHPINGFCYPRGAFSDYLAEAVKEAGYAYAVSTAYGSNGPDSNPYALRRRNIADYDGCRSHFPVWSIRMELTGLLDPLLRSRRSA